MASSRRRAQDVIRGRGNQRCPHHQGQSVVYKCTDCNKLACMTCVTTLHRKHELDEIDNVIPDAERKIQDFITSTEQNEIPKIRKKIKKVKADLSKNRQYYKNMISDIEKQRDILKSELDDMTNGFIKSCRDLEQGNEEILLKHSEDLKTVMDELNAQISECKDALHSGNNVQVIDISNETSSSKYKSIVMQESSSANFIPGKLELGTLTSLLGKLTISRPKDQKDKKKPLLKHQPNQPSTRPYKWSVVSQFTPSFNPFARNKYYEWKGYRIASMCAAPDNQVWICSSQLLCDDKLLLINDKGEIQQELETDVTVSRLCLHPTSGNIWFVSFDDNKVREITGSKSTERFHTSSKPLSICISMNGNIYIAHEREIVEYSQNGKVLCKTGDQLRSPQRISVCPVSGKLAALDENNEPRALDKIIDPRAFDKRSVMILNATLQILHTYRGAIPSNYKSTEPRLFGSLRNPFHPVDVCYNKEGEVLITDVHDNTVKFVNKKGIYVEEFCTGGEAEARLLCVQSNGDVYVSMSDNRVLVFRKVQQ